MTLTTPDTTATEGSSTDPASIVLTLNRGLRSGESLAVPLGFSGGAVGTNFTLALSGSPADVTLSGSTVTFSGPSTGATATVATVLLTASADSNTTNETVTVSIPASSSGNAPKLTATGLGGGATGSRVGDGQIALSDTTPEITIARGTSPVTEGTDATYTVSADPAQAADLTVNLAVADAPDANFVDAGNEGAGKTVTLAADTASATWTVPTVPDIIDEPNGPATVTVNDDDGPPPAHATTPSAGGGRLRRMRRTSPSK